MMESSTYIRIVIWRMMCSLMENTQTHEPLTITRSSSYIRDCLCSFCYWWDFLFHFLRRNGTYVFRVEGNMSQAAVNSKVLTSWSVHMFLVHAMFALWRNPSRVRGEGVDYADSNCPSQSSVIPVKNKVTSFLNLRVFSFQGQFLCVHLFSFWYLVTK